MAGGFRWRASWGARRSASPASTSSAWASSTDLTQLQLQPETPPELAARAAESTADGQRARGPATEAHARAGAIDSQVTAKLALATWGVSKNGRADAARETTH